MCDDQRRSRGINPSSYKKVSLRILWLQIFLANYVKIQRFNTPILGAYSVLFIMWGSKKQACPLMSRKSPDINIISSASSYVGSVSMNETIDQRKWVVLQMRSSQWLRTDLSMGIIIRWKQSRSSISQNISTHFNCQLTYPSALLDSESLGGLAWPCASSCLPRI